MIRFRHSFMLLVLSLAGCGPGRPHLQTLQLNQAGNKFLTAQTYPAAMEKYLEALSYDPFVGQLHLNLGLSFEGQQQAEKALQSYKEAETLATKEKNALVMFMARFNQAQLLGKAKKVDEALALYQKALELVPTSNEVKVNIELLTQNQQGGGGGEGENKDQQQNQQGGQGQDNKEQKDKKDQKDQKDQKEKDQPKDGPKQQSPKYKPRPFEGKELSEGDVKKILGELKQQEEKIRAEYNRKETKEQPRDKDW